MAPGALSFPPQLHRKLCDLTGPGPVKSQLLRGPGVGPTGAVSSGTNRHSPIPNPCYVGRVEWSWTTWLISAAAVVISGAAAWAEGHWIRRGRLAMGFANHGGMWSDLVLLSMANAVVVPHLTWGPWIVGGALVSGLASLWVHAFWYHPPSPIGAHVNGEWLASDGRDEAHFRLPGDEVTRAGDHMWPTHANGSWWRDLSWSGWAHVVYVTGELTLLVGFLLHSMPSEVVMLVAAIFTVHVPIGLLQPRWYKTGHIATASEQPLLAPLLLALWAVTMVKL
jgi:hypothetical protein